MVAIIAETVGDIGLHMRREVADVVDGVLEITQI